ncbi:MAG: DNA adenine methylase [Candidatus Cloacimonetes bacterium]|nr:DNA adenine methylase [Candidatus Cloacimonadota bacterium]
MLPYLGCKQFIANSILDKIPPADHFYDLFGGGGSVTEGALEFKDIHQDVFGTVHKWKTVHYNEINTGVYNLNKEIWDGTFDFDKASKTFITKKSFERDKDKADSWSAFVRIFWSYGQAGKCYRYGEKLELLKCLEMALVNSDYPFLPGATTRQKYAFLQDIVSRHFTEDICKDYDYKVRAFWSIDLLTQFERCLSKKARKNHKSYEGRLHLSNQDYREVQILPNSMVYCDIPYNTEDNDGYYDCCFDWEAFFEWGATRDFPVFFSEYECADSRFSCVMEVEKRNTYSGNKLSMEMLYWNGVENCKSRGRGGGKKAIETASGHRDDAPTN